MRIVPGRDFRLLVGAGTVSQLGDWSAKIALSVLVYQQTGSATAVGLTNAMMIAPWLGPGQWLASRCDRFDRRRLLLLCDAIRGLVFIMIGLGDLSLPVLAAMVALTATIDSVFEVNRSALLADLVDRDDYADAVQFNHTLDQAAQLLGYACGGVLAGFLGAGNALALNGITFLASAAMLLAISRGGTSGREAVRPSLSGAVAYLTGDRISLLAVVITVVSLFGVTSVEYQAVIYGQVVVGLSETGAGLLTAAVPAGTLVLLAVMRSSGDDLCLLRRGSMMAGGAAAGAALVLGLGRPLLSVFGGFALVGMVLIVSTFSNMVVGRRIPPEIRGSTFAVLQAVIFAAGSVGMASGGVASDLLTPRGGAAAAMGLVAVTCVAGAAIASRMRMRSGAPAGERRVLIAS